MKLYDFLSGAVALGFIICGLFFWRSWRKTREELFIAFAAAFVLLGIGQTAVALSRIPVEEKGALYLIRLVAFLIILFAIYRKNRALN